MFKRIRNGYRVLSLAFALVAAGALPVLASPTPAEQIETGLEAAAQTVFDTALPVILAVLGVAALLWVIPIGVRYIKKFVR